MAVLITQTEPNRALQPEESGIALATTPAALVLN